MIGSVLGRSAVSVRNELPTYRRLSLLPPSGTMWRVAVNPCGYGLQDFLSVVINVTFWASWPDFNLLTDHHGFSRHGASSLTRRRVHLLLVVFSLSVATICSINLFTRCTLVIFAIWTRCLCQCKHYKEDYDVSASVYLHPEDGGSMDLWNVGILTQNYTASKSRRLRLETSEDGGSTDLWSVGILP